MLFYWFMMMFQVRIMIWYFDSNINFFLNLAANDFIQLCWRTDDTDSHITLSTEPSSSSPPHPVAPSVIASINRIDTFLSNTGSFSGSFFGVVTGSLYGTASYAETASYVNTLNQAVIISGSFLIAS